MNLEASSLPDNLFPYELHDNLLQTYSCIRFAEKGNLSDFDDLQMYFLLGNIDLIAKKSIRWQPIS